MEMRESKKSGNKQPDNIEEELTEYGGDKQAINPIQEGKELKTYMSFSKSLLRVLNLCFSSFYFGYTLAYLGSFNFSSIIKLYDIQRQKDTVEGLLQGIVSIGAGFGALAASILLKSLSRRNSVLFINVIALACGILVLIPNLYLFFIIRFCQGACIGLYSAIVPLLIKQYSPTQICGIFGAFNQSFIAFGVFFAFVFQLILLKFNEELDHWRIVFGFTLITIAIQTLLLVFVYKEETPKYLLLNNRQQECLEYLKDVYKPEYVDKVLREKKMDLNLIVVKKQEKQESQKQNIEIMQVQTATTLNFQHGKKMRTITAIHLAVLQQFVGINCVVAYGVDIIARVIPSLAKIIPVILNLEGVLASLVSSILLMKLGRKIILQGGTFMSAVTLIMVSIGFLIQQTSTTTSSVFIITGLVIYMANFGLSLGPVMWLYIAETVEPEVIPFSTLANWAAASIVIIAFPILSYAFGTSVPLFLFFAAWSIASLFINKKLLIETKGKTEKQIRQQYCLK